MFRLNISKLKARVQAMRIRVAKGQDDLGDLLKLLRKKDPRVKQVVLLEMSGYSILAPAPKRSALQEEFVTELLGLLKHEWVSTQQLAIDCLGAAQSERAVEPLLALLKNENTDRLFGNVVRAFGKLNDKELIEPMVALFRPGLAPLQADIARTLGSYAEGGVLKGEEFPRVSEMLLEQVEDAINNDRIEPTRVGSTIVPLFDACLSALSSVESRSAHSSTRTVKGLAALLPALSKIALRDHSKSHHFYSFIVIFKNARAADLRALRQVLDSDEHVGMRDEFSKILGA